MSENNNIIGNGSSIFKVIGLLIAGYTTPWIIKIVLLYFGIDLSGQETEIMQGFGLIIASALSYVDMKYANSFFKKNITLEDFIAYGEKHFNMQTISCELEDDIDPSANYGIINSDENDSA